MLMRINFNRIKRGALCPALAIIIGVGPASAQQDWRTQAGTFRIGLIAENAPDAAGREAVKRAFSQALDIPVSVFVARDAAMLVDAQASGRVDYAVHTALTYASTRLLCKCVEPVAAPVDVDGATSLRSILIVRRGMASSPADLARLKLAVPSVDNVMQWLVPAALLPDEGVKLSGPEARLIRTASPSEAEKAFRDGSADALLGWERAAGDEQMPLGGGTLASLASDGFSPENVHIIWRSPPIRYGPHAALSSLDPEARILLGEFLTNLRESNHQVYDLISGGHAGGFVAASDAEFSPVARIVREQTR